MTASGCPSDDTLKSLLLGRLSQEENLEHESHVIACAECGVRTRNIQVSDPLLDVLPDVKDVSWSQEEEENSRRMADRFSDRSQLLARTVAMGETILTGHGNDPELRTEPGSLADVSTHSSVSPSEPTFASGAAGGSSQSGTSFHTLVLQPAEGAVLGSYRLEKKLGQGGMGAVWKAFHTKLKKPVALKVLAAHLLRDASLVARFEREMEAVGRLDHPTIVRAMDAGEVDGTHYLVMEYVEGGDFGQLVQTKGARSVRDACEMIRQAAIGLAYAHKSGLVHRDIKPSNLFLTKDGRIKILDLGLARLQGEGLAADVGAGLTGTGQILGTPDYMAPEQWENTHTVGPACDLYALGCTLFYLLTGQAPFADEAHQTLPKKMMGHMTHVPPSLSAVRTSVLAKARKARGAKTPANADPAPAHDIPPELETLYQRLLAKDPDARFATAEQLATALSNVTKARTPAAVTAPPDVEAPPSAPTENAAAAPKIAPDRPSSRSRMKWLATFGGFAAALLLGVIVITIKSKDGSVKTFEVEDSAEIGISRKNEPRATPPAGPPPVVQAGATPSVGNAPSPAMTAADKSPIDYAAERKLAERLFAVRTPGKGWIYVGLRNSKSGHEFELPMTVEALHEVEFTISDVQVYSGHLADETLELIAQCQHLEHLVLRSLVTLTDGKLQQLRSIRKLTKLDLEGCSEIGKELPSLIAANSNLRHLNLGWTSVTPDVLPALCNCRQLQFLSIKSTALPPESYAPLAENCRDLRELFVLEAHVVDIRALASLPSLRALAISGEHLTQELFEVNIAALKSMKSLESLTLDPPASDDRLARLAPLAKTLRHLKVISHFDWDPGVTAEGWKALDEFTALETLDIGGHKSEIDGPGLIRLASLPSLRTLSVRFVEQSQRFTAADVVEFRRRRPDISLSVRIGKEEKEFPALEHYPRGADGRSMAEWDLPAGAPPPALAPFSPEEAKGHQEAWAKFKGQGEVENSLGMKFQLIPPGQASIRLSIHGGGETAPVIYRITQPYFLGTTEVTMSQFRTFLDETGHTPTGTQPGGQIGLAAADGLGAEFGNEFWSGIEYDVQDDDPATLVSHADASAFCDWLSRKEGVVYRLPTECEWFFATAAGGEKKFGYVDTVEDLRAHEWDRSSVSFPLSKTSSPLHPVASLKPNPFGLYDMLGNVQELTRDRLSSDLSTFSPINPVGQASLSASHCGGSWRWDAAVHHHFGVGSRGWDDVAVTTGYCHIGFRVLKELPGASPLPKPAEVRVPAPPATPDGVKAAR